MTDRELAEKLGWHVEQMPWGAPNAGDWVLVDPDGVHDEPMATEAAAWSGVPNWASPLGFVRLLGRLAAMGWWAEVEVRGYSDGAAYTARACPPCPGGWQMLDWVSADTPQRALALAAAAAVASGEDVVDGNP